AFFGRAAVIAHAPLDPIGLKVILDGSCGEQRRRPEKIMAAAVPETIAFDRPVLCHARFLAQSGQRVVFSEDGNHGPTLARFARYRRRNTGDIARDAEALLLQSLEMLVAGFELRVGELRHAPYAIAQCDEIILLGVDQMPDILGIAHA